MGRGRGQSVEAFGSYEVELQALRKNIASLGFESYEVGGSLRAELLGQQINDIDVCLVGTNYQEIEERCKQQGLRVDLLAVADIPIGARIYGDWTPLEGIELALARREMSTGDSHTDFAVQPDSSITIEEDLLRRDFTCNAMARPILSDGSLGEWIDPLGGRDDIKAGILRAVSDKTIEEDPLRILRGFVRLAQDGLKPDRETLESMIRWSDHLSPGGPLTAERTWKELQKIISGPHAAEAMRVMMKADKESTIWKNVFPELAPMPGFDQKSKYHSLPLDEHSLQALNIACRNNYDSTVRWAALLHDCGKPASAWMGDDGFLHYYQSQNNPGSADHEKKGEEISRALLRRLRAPKKVEKEVPLLIREHMFRPPGEGSSKRGPLQARRLVQRVGRENIDHLLQLRRCDHGGKGKPDGEWMRSIERVEKLIEQERNNPLEVGDLAISGDYITKQGLSGPAVGDVLQELLSRVLAHPEHNEKDRLQVWADKLVVQAKRSEKHKKPFQ